MRKLVKRAQGKRQTRPPVFTSKHKLSTSLYPTSKTPSQPLHQYNTTRCLPRKARKWRRVRHRQRSRCPRRLRLLEARSSTRLLPRRDQSVLSPTPCPHPIHPVSRKQSTHTLPTQHPTLKLLPKDAVVRLRPRLLHPSLSHLRQSPQPHPRAIGLVKDRVLDWLLLLSVR